jgi:hypothetical protein
MKRDIRYYIIQVYVPSILIVALSWVSFWLDLDAIPARVSLGVLTALTLNTHGSSIQAQLPKVQAHASCIEPPCKASAYCNEGLITFWRPC